MWISGSMDDFWFDSVDDSGSVGDVGLRRMGVSRLCCVVMFWMGLLRVILEAH